LFAGFERAGRRTAAIQSLFATAKLNGLGPARWLADTLERLLICPTTASTRYHPLLPFANSTGS
jgi:transposase